MTVTCRVSVDYSFILKFLWEYGIFREGSHISTNQNLENSACSIMNHLVMKNQKIILIKELENSRCYGNVRGWTRCKFQGKSNEGASSHLSLDTGTSSLKYEKVCLGCRDFYPKI